MGGPANVGLGIVGGYVWTLEATAARFADITLRVVNGAPPNDIPIESAPEVPMFDWRELQRWGIHESRLPPGSMVRFRELTLWQKYRWHIIAAFVVVALQALLIGALLVERRRVRTSVAAALGGAKRVLQESEERFRRVFEEGPLGLALVGRDYRFVKVNSAFCQMVGYDEAAIFEMSFVDITHPDDVRADVELAGKLFKGEIPFLPRTKTVCEEDG